MPQNITINQGNVSINCISYLNAQRLYSRYFWGIYGNVSSLNTAFLSHGQKQGGIKRKRKTGSLNVEFLLRRIKLKKVFFKLATVILLAILLSGMALAADKVTLTLMWQNSGVDSGENWMRDTVELFQELHPHIEFELMDNTWGDQYLTQITTMMATGRTPDIFATWTSGRMEPFVEAGRMHNLLPLLESDPEFYDFLQAGPLASTTFGGGVYAIPYNLNAEFIYYNKNVFDNLGLSIPTTWDEFLNIIKVTLENDITPIALGNSEIWTGTIPFMMFASRIGGLEAIEETMRGERPWTDPIFIEAGQLLQDLLSQGAFGENVNGISPNEARGKFMTDQAAMWINGTWEIPTFSHQMGDDRYGIFSFPEIPGGKGRSDEQIVFADQAYAIGANSDDKDEAWEFLKFIFSPERQEALVRSNTLPATKVEVDPATANPHIVEALNLMANASGTMFPWDIPLGPFLGAEINKAVQLLYMGEAPEQVFQQFQRTVEDHK